MHFPHEQQLVSRRPLLTNDIASKIPRGQYVFPLMAQIMAKLCTLELYSLMPPATNEKERECVCACEDSYVISHRNRKYDTYHAAAG